MMSAVLQISGALSVEECRRVSYLCGDLDPQRCSLDPQAALQNVLLDHQRIGACFLMELVLRIKRYDLLRDVLSTSRSAVEGMLEHGRAVPEYRVLMADVSEDMDTDDLKSLTFLLRDTLPKQKLENVQSFLDVVVELEKLEQLSGEKMELMERSLRSIKRADLAGKIRRFQQTGRASPERLKLWPTPAPIRSPGNSHTSSKVHQIPRVFDKQTAVRRGQHSSSFCCQEEVYHLPSDPRGVCVIIDCVGTEADDLEVTFKSLSFNVVVHKLLNARDIPSVLRAVMQSFGLLRSGAFVCCIVSRIRSSHLLGTDAHGMGLSLDALRLLCSGPGLAGCPKLFFIQGYEACADADPDDGELEMDGLAQILPMDADVFWSSCVTGEQQLERADHRSVYLSALRAGLTRRTHMLDLHTAVNRAVSEHNSKSPDVSYSLDVRHTLRKKLYLS